MASLLRILCGIVETTRILGGVDTVIPLSPNFGRLISFVIHAAIWRFLFDRVSSFFHFAPWVFVASIVLLVIVIVFSIVRSLRKRRAW